MPNLARLAVPASTMRSSRSSTSVSSSVASSAATTGRSAGVNAAVRLVDGLGTSARGSPATTPLSRDRRSPSVSRPPAHPCQRPAARPGRSS